MKYVVAMSRVYVSSFLYLVKYSVFSSTAAIETFHLVVVVVTVKGRKLVSSIRAIARTSRDVAARVPYTNIFCGT